ncbi:MAG: hypothetical protein JWM02_3440 [Frankiales bacterium]|nr:hypothetical protein [Frankiales bacterium]
MIGVGACGQAALPVIATRRRLVAVVVRLLQDEGGPALPARFLHAVAGQTSTSPFVLPCPFGAYASAASSSNHSPDAVT